MTDRKRKIAGLLQRYEFIDFAKAVSVPPGGRKEHLRAYVDRNTKGRWKSYKGLRSLVPDIAGVVRGLDPTGFADLNAIHEGLKLICHRDDLNFNKDAATALFRFLRDSRLDAYADHPRGSLRIGPDRTITMGVEHYVVDGDRGVFRYVYPRRERLEGHIPTVLMSLIHHNYVGGDFSEFEVEMIDLSCEPEIGSRGGIKPGRVRNPRIIPLTAREVMPRELLNEEANSIYRLLMEIAEET